LPTFSESDWFSAWADDLDETVHGRITRRIARARDGNFGDCGPVGDGVSELRLHFGPGYRLYFSQQGKDDYLLVHGGVKDAQQEDIKRAKALKTQEETK
jgi:putative addiction module killer protein